MKKHQIISLIKLIRPTQWIKNGFVLMPLVFGGRLFSLCDTFRAFTALVVFCLAASATYIINDYMDMDRDRIHPLKKDRPLASGAITPMIGMALAASLVIVMFLTIILFRLPISTLWILVSYIILNCLYSWKFKNWVIIDVLVVSFGFLLRILAGGLAVNVELSSWLILCTFSVATFLVLGKRRHEVISLHRAASIHRPVLESYSIGFIDQLLQIVTTSTFIFYCLYAVTGASGNIHSEKMIITIPLVTYGIFRYLYLIYQKGVGGSPTELLLADYPLLICVMIWLACCIVVIYM